MFASLQFDEMGPLQAASRASSLRLLCLANAALNILQCAIDPGPLGAIHAMIYRISANIR